MTSWENARSIWVFWFVWRTAWLPPLSQADRAHDHVVVRLELFEELEDPRPLGKVAYPLDEMLLQRLSAELTGADSWVEIALFGKGKLDVLRRFASFEAGTQSHDQFGNPFAALDAEAFQKCFMAWVAALTKQALEIIAIDGKTPTSPVSSPALRRSVHAIPLHRTRVAIRLPVLSLIGAGVHVRVTACSV